MRPIDRYRNDKRREEAEAARPGFNKVMTDADLRRAGPKCTSMVCVFDMPDGTTLTLEGVWPSVDHLPLDILARAVAEKAAAEARKIGAKL